MNVKRIEKSATAAIAGFARRTTTRVRMRTSPQPSTRAASRYSSGIVRKNWRSRKIEKASPNQFGMISGASVADEVELGPQDVQRHDRDLGRQHHRDEDEQEDGIAALPAQAREGIGHRDARDEQAERRQPGVDRGVEGPADQSGDARQTSGKLLHWNGSGHRSRDSAWSRVISAVSDDEHERRQEQRRRARSAGCGSRRP